MSAPTLSLSESVPAPNPAEGSPSTSGRAALAVTLALRPDLWQPLVRYREDTRWTRLLAPADVEGVVDPSLHVELAEVEIWLLSWLPGQGTALHDHGLSAGAFAVAAGGLSERVVAADRRGRDAREVHADLGTGRVRMFGSHYVHQVRNLGSEPAVSVHVYAPRLSVMNTYRVEESRMVRIGTERAGVDW